MEKETVDIATGEVSRERWYLRLSSRQWGPRELLRLFRNHWSVENPHHVKDRSWDEDVHTCAVRVGGGLRRLGQHRANARRLEGWSTPDVHAPASQDAFRPTRPSPASTDELPDFAIVLVAGAGRLQSQRRRFTKVR